MNLADSLEPDDYDDEEDENELMRGAGMGAGGGDEDAFRSYMLDHAMMLDSADAHHNGSVLLLMLLFSRLLSTRPPAHQ